MPIYTVGVCAFDRSKEITHTHARFADSSRSVTYNTNRYNISLPPASHCERLYYTATIILASRIEFCFYSIASHYLRARTERVSGWIYYIYTMGTYPAGIEDFLENDNRMYDAIFDGGSVVTTGRLLFYQL